MRYRFLLPLLFFLFCFKPVFATIGGDWPIEILGLDKSGKKLYFLRHIHDESSRFPLLYFIDTQSSTTPVKLESVYLGLDDSDQDRYRFEKRLKKIRKTLSPLKKKDVKLIDLKTSVLKEDEVFFNDDMQNIAWKRFLISFEVKSNNLIGQGNLLSYCSADNEIFIKEWGVIPKTKKAFVVVSYVGIPFETCYVKEDIILMESFDAGKTLPKQMLNQEVSR